MIEFTTVVGIDDTHLGELLLTWPTWACHRPEILTRPLLLVCDGARPQAYWEEALQFLEHPAVTLTLWQQPAASQREKMLTALALAPARHVTTPWYLKLDTDAIAVRPGEWVQPEWFAPDDAGRVPVFIASPWGYTKPPDAIDRLDAWGDTVPALRHRPGLGLHPAPGARLVVCPGRIISWCFFGHTAWTRDVVSWCGDRLPIPSQDTYLWYCAERRGDFYRRVRMSRFGWQHFRRGGALRRACAAALGVVADGGSEAGQPSTAEAAGGSVRPAARGERRPRHAGELLRVIGRLRHPRMRGAEIGVARGELSQALLSDLPELFLYLVDLWGGFPRDSAYRRSGDGHARLTAPQQAAQAEAARAGTDFARHRREILAVSSLDAARLVQDASLDFAFLDADHTYQAVQADIGAWWPKVRPGGILCGHDFGHPRDRRGRWGVRRAVTEAAVRLGLDVSVGEHTIWWVNKPP